MSKNKRLLQEAILDVKSIKELALENAKVSLEENFSPKMKSMLSKRILEMNSSDDDDNDDMDDMDDINLDELLSELDNSSDELDENLSEEADDDMEDIDSDDDLDMGDDLDMNS